MRASLVRGVTAVVTVLAFTLALVVQPAEGDPPPGRLVPKRGIYFGGYFRPAEWTQEGQIATFTEIEADLGHPIPIVNVFYAWEKAPNPWREQWLIDRGTVPMISWDGTYTSRILNGSEDAYILRMADHVRSLEKPIFLRFFWEMDGNKKAAVVESPEKFIAAWRYVHDRFQALGATNAVWIWAPNDYAFDIGTANQYYPGDEYVDWVGADGYNWGALGHGYTWRTFERIFSNFYAQWAGRKPLMVAETGVIEEGGDKPQWIIDLRTTLRFTYPEIKAVVYFNSVDGEYNWRVQSTEASYRAFEWIGRRRYFIPDNPYTS